MKLSRPDLLLNTFVSYAGITNPQHTGKLMRDGCESRRWSCIVVLMQLFKRKPMFKYHSWTPECPPLPLLPALVGRMGASEFPAGWGFPLLSPWLHLPLSHAAHCSKSDLCRNLISFIKLQVTQGQVHLCFFHSVKLRILYVEDGQGMPAK